MRMIPTALAVFVLCLVTLPAGAATLWGASSLHFFGDSLSDRGRIYAASLGLEPKSPPYWEGRFSNGRVWAEHVARRFRDAGLPRSNQAYGGARAVVNLDLVPDIGLQARRYAELPRARRGDAPMAAIWIGANDVLFRDGGIRRVGREAADEAISTARYLARRGVDRFLFLNLPDLGRLPRVAGHDERARRATRGARAYNHRLTRGIRDMRADGHDVVLFNAFNAFESIFDDPGAFGFSDLTEPCLVGKRVCSKREARRKLFFDDTHPTAAAHAALAELVIERLERSAPDSRIAAEGRMAAAIPAPVPLPAGGGLLVTALAALAAAGARARARRTVAAGQGA